MAIRSSTLIRPSVTPGTNKIGAESFFLFEQDNDDTISPVFSVSYGNAVLLTAYVAGTDPTQASNFSINIQSVVIPDTESRIRYSADQFTSNMVNCQLTNMRSRGVLTLPGDYRLNINTADTVEPIGDLVVQALRFPYAHISSKFIIGELQWA